MGYIILAVGCFLVGYIVGRFVEDCCGSTTVVTPPNEITSVYEKGREHEW